MQSNAATPPRAARRHAPRRPPCRSARQAASAGSKRARCRARRPTQAAAACQCWATWQCESAPNRCALKLRAYTGCCAWLHSSTSTGSAGSTFRAVGAASRADGKPQGRTQAHGRRPWPPRTQIGAPATSRPETRIRGPAQTRAAPTPGLVSRSMLRDARHLQLRVQAQRRVGAGGQEHIAVEGRAGDGSDGPAMRLEREHGRGARIACRPRVAQAALEQIARVRAGDEQRRVRAHERHRRHCARSGCGAGRSGVPASSVSPAPVRLWRWLRGTSAARST